MDIIRFLLILLVPGLIGAITFSLVTRFRAEVSITSALIIDLLTFIIMITGLCLFKGITTMAMLLFKFTCINFTRNYALFSILIATILGAIIGLLRRFFLWVRS